MDLFKRTFFQITQKQNLLAKLRVSYGTTGSDRVPPYGYSPVVISNVDYPFGDGTSLTSGMTQPGFADPNVKWETNISKNIGVDLDFKKRKSRFSG